jgi:hypothetical protein
VPQEENMEVILSCFKETVGSSVRVWPALTSPRSVGTLQTKTRAMIFPYWTRSKNFLRRCFNDFSVCHGFVVAFVEVSYSRKKRHVYI